MANSDILILYPDIANAATRIQASNTFSGATNETRNHPGLNATRGARWQNWQAPDSNTTRMITYDMGPYNTKTINYVVCSRLDLLRAKATTMSLTVRRSTDDISYADEINHADIDALTLYGPNSNDYVELISTSSAYRYWQTTFIAGAAFTDAVIGKYYIGNSLDMGVALDDYSINRDFLKTSYFETSAGSSLIGRNDVPRYQLRLVWYGVSDAKVETFFQEVYARRFTTPVFLYTQTYHDVLENHRLIHCALVNAETENRDEKANFNTLTTDWVELIG